MLGKRRLIIVALAIIAVSAVVVYSLKPNKHNGHAGETAAIVDGLSVEFPNPEFIEETSEILMDLG